MLRGIFSFRKKDELPEELSPNEPDEETPLVIKKPDPIPVKCSFVIGAGLGRTGTTSLHGALNDLGYKTLHMRDILGKVASNPQAWFDWAKAKREKADNAHDLAMVIVKQILDDGYTATTDFPSCLLYKEFMEAIPDAKVILSVRSSGEAWADSVLGTIGAVGPLQCQRAPAKFDEFLNSYYTTTYPYLWEEIGVAPLGEVDCTKPLDRDALIKAHDDWAERVKASVPAEKLLVHTSKDGYGPICKHLGITDVPEEYPHLNDSMQFQAMIKRMKKEIFMYWTKIWVSVIVSVVIIVVVYYVFFSV